MMKTGQHLAMSGLPAINVLPWGAHVCHFYKTKQELLSTLVPYFVAGLKNHEKCIWITSKPINVDEAFEALSVSYPTIKDCVGRNQIVIREFTDWYVGNEAPRDVLSQWLFEEAKALNGGFTGLRITGNVSWLETEADWKAFHRYESQVSAAFAERKVIALCTYPLDLCTAPNVLSALRNHQFGLSQCDGEWELLHGAAPHSHV